ncbi:lipase member H [Diabrotica virgifera virgifera]|uniref:Lipase member H-like n=1 Tax=Diabrotica virgifera virgifera TaxID=50390 RepID=A0A6P7F2C7_DIAVI|nr:lipase member H [Diabrotica virgifera virgifera]
MKSNVVLVLLVTFFFTLSLSDPSSDDVIFNFYKEPKISTEIIISKIDELKDAGFDATHDTVLLIYSYGDPSDLETKWKLSSSIFGVVADLNIFVVDWSKATTKDYFEAQKDVTTVGGYITEFLNALVSKYTLNLDRVTIIGWDLGAHIAGTAGKKMDKKLSTIIGLDPAGPLFVNKDTSNRLLATDANYVQVIHTNALINGFSYPCGTADYYPNGGENQTSCGNDITGVCSHQRSLAFYVESLTSDKFVSYKCDDYDSYKNGTCKLQDDNKSIMGQFTTKIDTKASGTYFLDTNDKPPYAKG